uniref:Neurotensin receptor type 1-like n=2 Tax=Petromyzon marinus TaxID=7757 RepID=A0AAJ7T1X9_PETMA|nr:neurotensin receptor type 1-like [Petromyzon marinus]
MCLTINITISVEERGVQAAIMNHSVHAAAAAAELRPTATVAAHSSSGVGGGIGVNDSAHANSSGQQSLEISTSLGSKAFITALYMALFVVGTVGNAVTLYVVLRKRSARHLQHGTAHYHLVSMAASDLLTLMLGLPVELYNFIWVHDQWAFGDLGCRGYYYLRDSCTYATVLNITSLSVERYLAVCHPLRAMTVASPRRTRRLVAAVWFTSFLLALPMALVMGQQVYVERRHGFVDEHVAAIHVCTCVSSIDTLKVVIQVNVFLAFVFPMLAISALNSAIVRQLMRLVDKPAPEPEIGQEQGCVARSRGGQGGGLQACRHTTALNLGRRLCPNGRVEAARVHALRNSVKVLRAIVIAFVVCWLPYHSRRLMFCYVPDSAWHPAVFNFYHYFYMLTNTLYYVSSAINPVLYNLVSAGFRHTFAATLGCRRAEEREPGTMQVYTRAGSSQSSVHTVTSTNHDCAAPCCSNPGRAREALN